MCLVAAAPASAQLPPNMRSYYVALMKKGPAWTAPSSPEANAVQQAHLAYLESLETEKKLVAAGPISDNSELRGVLVFDVAAKADAERLVAEDPAVKANRLSPLVLEWFGEKGIGEAYRARRAATPGAAVPTVPHQFGLLMRGPNQEPRPKELAAEIQKGHIANLEAMHAAGILVAAGPFGDGGDHRGIVVFRAKGYDEVFDAVEKDPAIRAGRLVLRLYRWSVPEGGLRQVKVLCFPLTGSGARAGCSKESCL
jgi:uncharacterized protein YciI